MQMMESDEEDEGDAEFAVEISKQELVVFILGFSPCSSLLFCSGECNKRNGSQAGKPSNLQRPHCETRPCFTGTKLLVLGIVRVGCDSSEVIKIPNFSAPPLPIASQDQTQEDIRNKRVSFCQL